MAQNALKFSILVYWSAPHYLAPWFACTPHTPPACMGPLIKCDKKSKIMQQFRVHHHLCDISGLIMREIMRFFQFILSYYTWSKEKKVFSTHLRPVSTSANFVARTGTVACSSIEKKQSDWISLILDATKLNLIQLPELTARSPVNARFQLRFHTVHSLTAHRLVARPNSPK